MTNRPEMIVFTYFQFFQEATYKWKLKCGLHVLKEYIGACAFSCFLFKRKVKKQTARIVCLAINVYYLLQ